MFIVTHNDRVVGRGATEAHALQAAEETLDRLGVEVDLEELVAVPEGDAD